MFRAKDALELGRRQPLADRTQIFGLSQHVPDRVWERSGPADERFQQGRIAPQMHGDPTRQVPRFIDQPSPDLPPFPEPVVRRIRSKDQQQTQCDAEECVDRRRDRDLTDIVIKCDHADRPGHA